MFTQERGKHTETIHSKRIASRLGPVAQAEQVKTPTRKGITDSGAHLLYHPELSSGTMTTPVLSTAFKQLERPAGRAGS